MLRVITLSMLVGSCVVAPEPVEEPLEGLRAQFVCLRYSPSGVCMRSEWRCTAPLTITFADRGRPRCVMPGSE